jgi:glutamate synthase (NADPH/NADH) small chain
VVILGGGDTGSDCLGTAHRQGCAEVHQFEILPEPPQSRSPSTPWPLWPMQLRSSHAHEEGGKRDWSVSTTEFLGRDGRVTGLRAQRVAVEGGRFVPVVGSEFELKADLVLLAMGFTGALIQPLVDALKLETNTKGTVRVGSEFMTSRRGVFASGDARLGASLIVWAIADGRKMAASIDEFLRSN